MDTIVMRPYLVIPKLIEQPTWGGTYIAETKRWQNSPNLVGKKIGQSYELYDKSNLSFAHSSLDGSFSAELTDSKLVELQSRVADGLPLADLIAVDPALILGKHNVQVHGFTMHLLLKFTQALGNSFQLHIADGVNHPRWKPKPESWYYFEPGLITCGVKSPVHWEPYQKAVTALDHNIAAVSEAVKQSTFSFEDAQKQIASMVEHYDPWQYVNLVRVAKGTLLDMSPCGIHHSWEEDLATIPLGNVLYEIQLNVMDDVSTIRSFDKGKMAQDGSLRSLQIDDFFALADRSESANDPQTHMRNSIVLQQTDTYTHERLLATKYYSMEKVSLSDVGNEFISTYDSFRHIFVRSGAMAVQAGEVEVTVTTGHSVFIPAVTGRFVVRALESNTEILISY